MPALTRDEAETRAALLDVHSYDIDMDLTRGDEVFGSTTTVRFGCRTPGAATFVELRPVTLRQVVLNGTPLDPADLRDNRLPLTGLAAENELVVHADMAYSRTGEGLHRFTDPADGKVYLYAQTFLDAAQRMWACFDQPDLKAVYRVAVTADEGWTVLGNAPATRVAPGRWTLAETRPLSTYLVTLVAGPYHSVYGKHDGIPLGLHCRASLAAHLDAEAAELLTVTAQCLDRFHDLFGIRYPFGKYDQAFVPEFNAGAMENPGCVTFRDEFVFRGAVTDFDREQRAMVVAHEMAHMWFGDLVTMRWWDDLWLNESFAEYMGYRVCGEATRFTRSWTTFAVGRKFWGYAADQRPSTHPVAGGAVADTGTALLNFDGISYAKGASVLKQLVAWLGDDAFLRGVRRYFDAHAYGNASLADLLAALSEASGRDLDAWARAWLRAAQVNTLVPAVTGGDGYESVTVAQTAPADHPTLRPHRIGIGLYDRRDGRVVRRQRIEVDVAGAHTPVPALTGAAVPELLLLNDGDLTYAKIRLDPATARNLPAALPELDDSLTRALLWGAVMDAVRDGEQPAGYLLDLAAAALPAETEVTILNDVLGIGRAIADRFLTPAARAAAMASVAAACHQALSACTPDRVGHQLAFARGYVSFAHAPGDLARVRDWLRGVDVPPGLPVDADLRWSILYRLVVTGQAGPADIDAEYARDTSALGEQHAARCRAARPDPDAKSRAWEFVTSDNHSSNRAVLATAAGFWPVEQVALTAGYVDRYFAEMPGVAAWQSPQLMMMLAADLYPSTVVSPDTLAAAEALLARDDLAPGLRRSVVDGTDDLRRALRGRSLA